MKFTTKRAYLGNFQNGSVENQGNNQHQMHKIATGISVQLINMINVIVLCGMLGGYFRSDSGILYDITS